jgi:putative tricarboxylic transport membrane protein
MKKLDIPMAPVVLTYVLSGMMESALLRSIKMNRGSLRGLVESPISLTMLLLSLLVLVSSLYAELKNKKSKLLSDSDD